jgi:hypothetical protein
MDNQVERVCAWSLVRAPPRRLLPAADSTQAELEALPPPSPLRTTGTRTSSNADWCAGAALLLFAYISAEYCTVRFNILNTTAPVPRRLQSTSPFREHKLEGDRQLRSDSSLRVRSCFRRAVFVR